jgi:Zn-dependent metalloprotease
MSSIKKSNSSKTKAQLYNDLHPEKSLKNCGFKDIVTALNTIKLVSKRSLRYQFDVINTMYNRAKYHPYRTKQMDDAIKIFKKWLEKYPDLKEIEDKKYKFLSLKQIEKYIEIAEIYGLSDIDKGIKQTTKTDKNFLQIFKEVGGKSNKLQYIPVKMYKPEGQDYWSYRIEFINSKLGQMKKAKTPLYYIQGKFKGLPTKQHLILILYGYSPDKKIYFEK